MITVLVADDSATDRALLAEILRADPELRVVGEARDGVEAVALTQRLRPRVVTMDLQMPNLDGLAATKEIMITAPTPIVLVAGSSKLAEAELAMHALRAGAVAALRKPPGPASPDFEAAARVLRNTVKDMAEVKVVRRWRPAAADKEPRRQGDKEKAPAVSSPSPPAPRVVAVAASTGGPEALQRLLSGLPGDFAAPILVVQHITPGFTEGLASWLSGVCDLRVKVADHGEPLAPHTVYLAPDDRHLTVARPGHVLLSTAPPVYGFRPSATPLFESAARLCGPAAAAVILTGMGDDGVVGLRAVRQAGGRVFAQDEKSCVVFGMPGAAVAEGLADLTLPPEAIAARLSQRILP
jgi:two-component system, chemotaxis family, protein-glutamate methylesterase/glutaminase